MTAMAAIGVNVNANADTGTRMPPYGQEPELRSPQEIREALHEARVAYEQGERLLAGMTPHAKRRRATELEQAGMAERVRTLEWPVAVLDRGYDLCMAVFMRELRRVEWKLPSPNACYPKEYEQQAIELGSRADVLRWLLKLGDHAPRR